MINKKNILLVAFLVAHVSVESTSTVRFNIVKEDNKANENFVVAPQGTPGASPEAGKDSAAPNNGATKTDDNPVVAPQGTPGASPEVLKLNKKSPEDNDHSKSKSSSGPVVSEDANKGIFASVGAYCSGAVGGASAAVTAHPVLAVAGGAVIIAGVIWTVYAHKVAQRAKTLEQEFDELESAV